MACEVAAERHRSETWPSGLAALVSVGLAVFAYRHVLLPGSRGAWSSLPDAFFFDAGRVDPVPPLLVAGWLLLRRRRQLRLRRGPPARVGACAAGLAALGLLAWSRFSGAAEPAALALPISVLAGFLAWGGGGAARAAALPIALLLFALPPPAPLYNALIWKLQLWTSVCVSGVLQALGLAPQTSGDLIVVGEQSFHVIESCAGLRIVQLLTLLAVGLGDALGLRGARALGFVAAAPLIGFGVNGLRALSIAVAPGSSEEVHHLGQGLATFGAACVLQYALGVALRRGRPAPAQSVPAHAPAGPRTAWGVLVLAAGLAGVSVWVPRAERAPQAGPPLAIRLADPPAGWQWVEQPRPLIFLGATRYADSLRRIYWPESGVGSDGGEAESAVDFFAGLDLGAARNGFPFGPKTALPGPGWVAEREAAAATPLPGTRLRVLQVRRGEQRMRVHEYRSGERNVLLESLYWLVGLDPLGAPARRAVVRLATPDGAGADARLDALFEALREPLTAILVDAEPPPVQRSSDAGPGGASSSARRSRADCFVSSSSLQPITVSACSRAASRRPSRA